MPFLSMCFGNIPYGDGLLFSQKDNKGPHRNVLTGHFYGNFDFLDLICLIFMNGLIFSGMRFEDAP